MSEEVVASPDKPAPDRRFTQHERDFLATINRRIRWLLQRQDINADKPQSQALNAWIRRELAALHWVLRVLTEYDHNRPIASILDADRRR